MTFDGSRVSFRPSGDTAIVVEFGDTIDRIVNSAVRAFCRKVTESRVDGLGEVVPTYRSALVYYDPMVLTRDRLVDTLRQMVLSLDVAEHGERRILVVPTLYGGDYGPDLGFVAQHTGLSEQEVVEIHSGRDYYVYMLGFTPGYPYMGGMDERLATPRLSSPRLKTPAGSVGIAGEQTGIYSLETPGGWRIIGRTPLMLFDPGRKDPFLLESGSMVRFKPVSVEEYEAIRCSVLAKHYSPEVLYE